MLDFMIRSFAGVHVGDVGRRVCRGLQEGHKADPALMAFRLQHMCKRAMVGQGNEALHGRGTRVLSVPEPPRFFDVW